MNKLFCITSKEDFLKKVKAAFIFKWILVGFFLFLLCFITFSPAQLTFYWLLNYKRLRFVENFLIWPILLFVFSVLYLVYALFYFRFKKIVVQNFFVYRDQIEENNRYYQFLMKEIYRRYMKVNCIYYLNKKNQVKYGYKRNSVACLIVSFGLIVATFYLLVLYSKSSPFEGERLLYYYILPTPDFPMMEYMAFGRSSCLIVIALTHLFYSMYRFKEFKKYAIEVSVEDVLSEKQPQYDEKILEYSQSHPLLAKRNQWAFRCYQKNFLTGLYNSVEDALLFGILLSFAIIYVYLLVWIIAVVCEICGHPIRFQQNTTGGTDSLKTETVCSKKLIIHGNGYNEKYEITSSGDIIQYGQYTDYFLIGGDIYRKPTKVTEENFKIGFLIGYPNDERGSVGYVDSYSGEKPFLDWEYTS